MERKGPQTTEFWVSIIVNAFCAITLLLMWLGRLPDIQNPGMVQLALLSTLGLSTGGYAIARGLAKQ